MEYLIRFLAGSTIVSLVALLGDIIRPKSFAGLLAAAPSVALVILGLAFASHDPGYVATQGWSMALGSIALAVYSYVVCLLLMRHRVLALPATAFSLALWLGIASSL